ncbi:MAG: hypothetical protein ACYC2R_06815 [Burkholderiales bacterium]
MTIHREMPTIETPLRVEKTVIAGPNGAPIHRWIKTLGPSFPAADYWLCHEARIVQDFTHAPHVAQFIAVDVEQRFLITEAQGYTLAQLLLTPAGELQHPFQRSSDLIRLLIACCRAIQSIHDRGVIHSGLRPDTICLDLDDRGHIDYANLRIFDFSSAHSLRHPIEKPLYLDPAADAGAYLSPAMRRSIDRDWKTFARLSGIDRRGVLESKAKTFYATQSFPKLRINRLNWRIDLYSLGYWFRQLSLRRIDFYSAVHQERLPKLLNRMQLSLWQGGYASMSALLKELNSFELDQASPSLSANPAAVPLASQAPLLPVGGIPAAATALEAASDPTDKYAPATHSAREESSSAAKQPSRPSYPSKGKRKNRKAWLKMGLIGGLAFAAILLGYLTARPKHTARPSPQVPVRKPAPPASSGRGTAPAIHAQAAIKPAAAPVKSAAETLASLRAAASQGDADAQTHLGLLYRNGTGVAQSNAEAVKWYAQAAEHGHPEAQAYLGFMYMTGRGVKRDDAIALKWHRKAAEQGNPIAQYNLGLMTQAGRGVKANATQAYIWFKLASASNIAAQNKLRELIAHMANTDILEGERLADEWRNNHSSTP